MKIAHGVKVCFDQDPRVVYMIGELFQAYWFGKSTAQAVPADLFAKFYRRREDLRQ